jgi:hypothetical protein
MLHLNPWPDGCDPYANCVVIYLHLLLCHPGEAVAAENASKVAGASLVRRIDGLQLTMYSCAIYVRLYSGDAPPTGVAASVWSTPVGRPAVPTRSFVQRVTGGQRRIWSMATSAAPDTQNLRL